MKISRILLGRSVRFGAITGPSEGPIYGWHLVRHCQERYGFLQHPQSLSDFDYERGVTFLHGIFRSLVVGKFQIFNTGMIAEAQAETDFCADFLEDVISSLIEQGIIHINAKKGPNQFFFSELEMMSSVRLDEYFNIFNQLGERISGLVSSYGQEVPTFTFGSLALSSFGNIPWFRFENKVNAQPGVFYTSAPLQTAHHLAVLEDLEGLLAKIAAS
ncbi:MAG: hypothetical protein AB7I59_04095 [Geminicoccaceae bacterium]